MSDEILLSNPNDLGGNDTILNTFGQVGRSIEKGRPLGFNYVNEVVRRHGAYRPARNIPISFLRGNVNDYEGFVWSQGKILSVVPSNIYAGLAWTKPGITAGLKAGGTGAFYVRRGDSSSVEVPYGHNVFGYSNDIEGFIVPANGSIIDVNELYTTYDADLTVIDSSTGSSIVAGVTPAITRGALSGNTVISGVALSDQMRETRSQSVSYLRETEAFAIGKQGYLYVPFAVSSATDFVFETYNGAVFDAAGNHSIITKDQAALLVAMGDEGLLRPGSVLEVDKWGNPIIYTDPSNGYSSFGGTFVLDSISFGFDIPQGEKFYTPPGTTVAGNQTAGIEEHLYYLAKKVARLGVAVDPDSPTEMKAFINGGRFGLARVYFDFA